MSYSTIAIVYNPNSTGSSELLAKGLKEQIKSRLPEQKVELIQTEHAGHGEELAYSLAKASQNPLIISSSGDGGYNEVVNGAMKAQNEGAHPTLGLLPAGNANDHYNSLHRNELIDQIVSNRFIQIDLLKIKGLSKGKHIERYAHSYIGFGLTPIVGNELNKTKLNPINEAGIVARSLFTLKSVKLMIGGKTRSYESVIFSNVDVMSKYLKISRSSSMTDGKFEVTLFRHRNKLKLILLLLKASLKGVEEDHQVSEFSLSTVRQTLAQVDGEIVTFDARVDIAVHIEPRVLRCII